MQIGLHEDRVAVTVEAGSTPCEQEILVLGHTRQLGAPRGTKQCLSPRSSVFIKASFWR